MEADPNRAGEAVKQAIQKLPRDESLLSAHQTQEEDTAAMLRNALTAEYNSFAKSYDRVELSPAAQGQFQG